MAQIRDMTRGSIVANLVVFALPLMLTTFFQVFYVTVGSIVVGRWAGEVAFAAVSNCSFLISVFVCFFNGLSLGAGVILAQLFGAGEFGRFGRCVWTVAALALAGGVIITVSCVVAARPCLALMNLDGAILDDAVTYMTTYAFGLPFLVIYNMGSAIFRAYGDSRTPMFVLVVSSLVNVGLVLLFVAVCQMGVFGAALATVIAQLLSAAITVTLVWHRRVTCYIDGLRPVVDRVLLRQMLAVGVPNGIQSTAICISCVIISSAVNLYGIETIDGFGAYMKASDFLSLPVQGFQGAITTFVGQNVGAQRFDRVRKCVPIGVSISFVAVVALTSLFLLFSRPVLGLFSPDAGVIEKGVEAAFVMAPFYPFFAIYMSMFGVFFGVGSTVPPMAFSITFMCVLRVIWVWLVQTFFPSAVMVYLSYPGSWALMLVATLLYYRFGNWRYHKRIKEAKTIDDASSVA